MYEWLVVHVHPVRPHGSDDVLTRFNLKVLPVITQRTVLWLKVSLVKAWFYGSVCFFFLWGLGGYLADALDLFFVTAIALGMVTDLLINTLLKYYAETDGANDRWMMVPRRGVAGFFLNILYAFLVLGLVDLVYNVINLAILSVKHLLGRIVADARAKASQPADHGKGNQK